MLTVEVEAAANGGLWGEVALEVRCTAYLRKMKAAITGDAGAIILVVTGEIIGFAERPLDLYVLVENSTVSYTTLEVCRTARHLRSGLTVSA